MSNWITTHQPCPLEDCDSSNAYSTDDAGGGWCFSCHRGTIGKGDSGSPKVSLTVQEADLSVSGRHMPLPERGISEQTCAFFNVKTDERRYIFPYYNAKGQLVAQKLRYKDLDGKGKKSYPWKGAAKEGLLFGQNKFHSGNTVTIVEGEFDALAYRDLVGDYPVVSVKNGAQGGVKDVKNNLEYFKNFNKIYVCMDNDEHGKAASIKIAELFPIGKVKIVHLRHHKDANDYLLAGDTKKFQTCWWSAADFTPAGIESANQGGFDSLFEDVDNLELFPYPYDKLNESTFGIRKSEMVTVVAGSGTGKSAFVSEVAYNLLMPTNKKVGCLFMEESPKKTKLKFMSLYLNKPLHLTLLGRVAEKFDFLEKVLDKLFKNSNDWKWSEDVKRDLRDAWKHVIEKKAHDGEQQLWLYNHFGSNSIDAIVSKIDAMVTGLGCEFIFLDHISIVVSDQQNADERKALDELATKLRTLVEQRNFSLILVSHLRRPGGKPHEEGGETSLADIRGTAGIGQLSDVVIGLERNGQHDDEYLRNVTKIRVLKNRFAGFTGLTSCVHYEIETGRLTEVDTDEVIALERASMEKETKKEWLDDSATPFDNSRTGQSVGLENVDKSVA